MTALSRLCIAASLSPLLLAGCRITDNGHGKNDNVDISTPFGSMKVKTNDTVDTASIGISAYPGAVPVKDDGDKDNNSADINLNFGDFHLGVKAASFQTNDSKDKVIAFYKQDLAKFGDIIMCQDDSPVGTPTRTSQGLSCKDNDSKDPHVTVNGIHTHTHGQLELRTGSETRQHIVSVESRDGGTRIGLVALNLPSQLHSHDKNETE